MHAQCTSNAPPSHSHDTMHEQTIPTTCTHNHRHHAIHSTHLRNSTPFGKHIHPLNSECCLPCLKAQKTGSRGFRHWFTDVRIHHHGCPFRVPQVQLHKVQEVVQIYQAFLRNIRVSRESSFGPGVHLRFLEKFSKRFGETTKNLKQRKCEEELQYVKARTQHPPKPASQKCHKRSCLSPFLLCSSHHRLCIQLRFRGFSLQTSIIRYMLVYTPSYRDVYILNNYTVYQIQYHLQENLFFATLHPDIHRLPNIPLIDDKQICMHVLVVPSCLP